MSITLTSKNYIDDFIGNKIFAKCGGISALELTNDEVQYLALIDYSFNINDFDYYCYIEKLEKYYNKIRQNNNKENSENRNIENIKKSNEIQIAKQ